MELDGVQQISMELSRTRRRSTEHNTSLRSSAGLFGGLQSLEEFGGALLSSRKQS